MYGVTDGKTIGTYVEQKFKNYLRERFSSRQVIEQAGKIDGILRLT